MDDLQQITAELSGKTNFDAEHEGDLFERIAIIEKQEAAGELIPGLNKVDCRNVHRARCVACDLVCDYVRLKEVHYG